MSVEELLKYINAGLLLAKTQISVEKLSGNIVKEEFWKGELAAYTAVVSMIMELEFPE